MRTLLLFRHGKAVPSDPDNDHARPLTERGRAQAETVAGLLDRLGLQPELALVSDARRTRETAQGALRSSGAEPLFVPDLYAASAETIFDAIRTRAGERRCVMVVGHNPGIGDAARLLTGRGELQAQVALQDSFPTGSLAVLEFDPGAWSDLAPGTGVLTRFIVPERG